MKKSQIVLNHLVFASDRENGGQQLDMLKKLLGLEFTLLSYDVNTLTILLQKHRQSQLMLNQKICVFSIRYPMICLLIIALIQS